MKLSKWMNDKGLNDREMATRVKTARPAGSCTINRSLARSWRLEKTVPRPANMRAIYHITGGAVDANDFNDLPVDLPAPESESAQ